MAEQSEAKHNDYYANMVNFGTTMWDMMLRFGQVMDRGEGELFEPRVSVTLPWLQIKAMTVYLQLNLFAYEQTHGKINVPRHLLPSFTPDPETTDPNVRAHAEILQSKVEQIIANMDALVS